MGGREEGEHEQEKGGSGPARAGKEGGRRSRWHVRAVDEVESEVFEEWCFVSLLPSLLL
jgi:hypothetical protein